MTTTHGLPVLAAAAAAAMLAACATPTPAPGGAATIQRTAFGVPHISAPDLETLAYGVA